MKKAKGVYVIHIPGSDKLYIGSGVSVSNRASYHRWKLNKGVHDNKHLQRSFDKHGFVMIYPLEYRDDYAEREQYWINLLKPEFNMRKVSESNAGLKFVDQWKRERERQYENEVEYKKFLSKHLSSHSVKCRKRRVEACSKKVILIIKGEVFEYQSIKEASEDTGISRDSISRMLHGKNKKKKCKNIWKFE